MSGFGGGVGSCPLFSAGSAVPVATEEATGIDSNAKGLPSNQPFPAPYRATSTQAGPGASRWLAT